MEDADSVAALRTELAAARAECEQLRQELRASKPGGGAKESEFLQSLLRALPAFIMRIGPDLELRFINRLADGFTEADVLGKHFLEFVDPNSHERTMAAVARMRETGTVERFQVLAQGDHRQLAHYESIIAPLVEPDGRMGFVLIASDVSAGVEREKALEASRESLRLAVDATGIGLWSLDVKSGQPVWSERMQQVLGRTETLPFERYAEEIAHPDDREIVAEYLKRLLGGDESAFIRHRIVRPGGEVRWLIPSGKLTRSSDGTVVRVTGGMLDVTDIHNLETRLRHAERLEAIGTLTAGVAHNLNNLLAVLRPTLDLLRQHVSEPGRKLLDDADLAAERAAKVVRQLMTFAKQRQGSQTRVVLAEELVKSATAIARRSIPESIAVELTSTAPLAHLECEPSELSEAIMNLLFNARDALTSAGTENPRIEIKIEPREGHPGWVELTVTDNGPGMDEATRRRIFDPFFTTKGPQRGLGLGLSITWSVVQACGGSIQCESSPSTGTRFSIQLPRTQDSPENATRRRSEAPRVEGLRVLLVEDDEDVRRATRRVLDSAQHHVVEASSGAEALQLADAEPFDVVLLDYSLPDGVGTEIIPELRCKAGAAKILLFSGHDIDEAALSGVDALLQKPLRASELLRHLSNVAKK